MKNQIQEKCKEKEKIAEGKAAFDAKKGSLQAEILAKDKERKEIAEGKAKYEAKKTWIIQRNKGKSWPKEINIFIFLINKSLFILIKTALILIYIINILQFKIGFLDYYKE